MTAPACVGMVDIHFDETDEVVRFAKLVCADCPVRLACLQVALDNNEQYGVWGGATFDERTRMRRRARRVARQQVSA